MPPRWTVMPAYKRVRPPGFIAPCLPALVDHVPAGPDWSPSQEPRRYALLTVRQPFGRYEEPPSALSTLRSLQRWRTAASRGPWVVPHPRVAFSRDDGGQGPGGGA